MTRYKISRRLDLNSNFCVVNFIIIKLQIFELKLLRGIECGILAVFVIVVLPYQNRWQTLI